MLVFQDILFTIFHLVIILFNLFGWISVRTRKAHLICITLTAASWFFLGIWFGIGYCPITEWQWNIKERLGETNLPASFITYYGEKITGRELNEERINMLTIVCFGLAVIMSLYVNFFRKKRLQGKANGKI